MPNYVKTNRRNSKSRTHSTGQYPNYTPFPMNRQNSTSAYPTTNNPNPYMTQTPRNTALDRDSRENIRPDTGHGLSNSNNSNNSTGNQNINPLGNTYIMSTPQFVQEIGDVEWNRHLEKIIQKGYRRERNSEKRKINRKKAKSGDDNLRDYAMSKDQVSAEDIRYIPSDSNHSSGRWKSAPVRYSHTNFQPSVGPHDNEFDDINNLIKTRKEIAHELLMNEIKQLGQKFTSYLPGMDGMVNANGMPGAGLFQTTQFSNPNPTMVNNQISNHTYKSDPSDDMPKTLNSVPHRPSMNNFRQTVDLPSQPVTLTQPAQTQVTQITAPAYPGTYGKLKDFLSNIQPTIPEDGTYDKQRSLKEILQDDSSDDDDDEDNIYTLSDAQSALQRKQHSIEEQQKVLEIFLNKDPDPGRILSDGEETDTESIPELSYHQRKKNRRHWNQQKANLFFLLVSYEQTTTLEILFNLARKRRLPKFDFNVLTKENPRNHHAIHIAIAFESLPMLHTLCTETDFIKVPDDAILHAVQKNWKAGIKYLYRYANYYQETDPITGKTETDHHRLIIGSKTGKEGCREKICPPGVTPLMLAAKENKYKICKYILKLQTRYQITQDPYLTQEELTPSIDCKGDEILGFSVQMSKSYKHLSLSTRKKMQLLLFRIIPSRILPNDQTIASSMPTEIMASKLQSSFLLWEFSSWRWWLYHAKTSPALMIAMSLEYDKLNRQNVLIQMILKTYKELISIEGQISAYRDQYAALKSKLENFLCDLLSLVQSSEELGYLFKYDPQIGLGQMYNPWKSKSIFFKSVQNNYMNDIKKSLTKKELDTLSQQHLYLLEECIDLGLKEMVAHVSTQHVMNFFNYRFTPWVQSDGFKKNVYRFLGAVFYPIWSLFMIFCPNAFLSIQMSKSPWFIHSLWLGSEAWFLMLILCHAIAPTLLNPSYKNVIEYFGRGVPPTIIELIIFLFVAGKIKEEIREAKKRGWDNYLKDSWNWSDILQILFLVAAGIFRAMDFVYFRQCRFLHDLEDDLIQQSQMLNDTVDASSTDLVTLIQNNFQPGNLSDISLLNCDDRIYWENFEPRKYSEICMGFAASLTFVRCLGILRVFESIGPNTGALMRMSRDVLQVVIFFALLLLSFSAAMLELYGYYGHINENSHDHLTEFCQKQANLDNNLCQNRSEDVSAFTTCVLGKEVVLDISSGLLSSLWVLFWAALDITDSGDFSVLDCYNNISVSEKLTNLAMNFLLACFSVISVVVLINMVIAMMTKSYDDSTKELQKEWVYSRASVFIRYLRGQWPQPVPMNLIPDFNYYLTRCFCNPFTACQNPGDKEKAFEPNKNVYRTNSTFDYQSTARQSSRKPQTQSDEEKISLRATLRHERSVKGLFQALKTNSFLKSPLPTKIEINPETTNLPKSRQRLSTISMKSTNSTCSSSNSSSVSEKSDNYLQYSNSKYRKTVNTLQYRYIYTKSNKVEWMDKSDWLGHIPTIQNNPYVLKPDDAGVYSAGHSQEPANTVNILQAHDASHPQVHQDLTNLEDNESLTNQTIQINETDETLHRKPTPIKIIKIVDQLTNSHHERTNEPSSNVKSHTEDSAIVTSPKVFSTESNSNSIISIPNKKISLSDDEKYGIEHHHPEAHNPLIQKFLKEMEEKARRRASRLKKREENYSSSRKNLSKRRRNNTINHASCNNNETFPNTTDDEHNLSSFQVSSNLHCDRHGDLGRGNSLEKLLANNCKKVRERHQLISEKNGNFPDNLATNFDNGLKRSYSQKSIGNSSISSFKIKSKKRKNLYKLLKKKRHRTISDSKYEHKNAVQPRVEVAGVESVEPLVFQPMEGVE